MSPDDILLETVRTDAEGGRSHPAQLPTPFARVGANASLLDRIEVDYYGAPTPLRSLASINTPDSSTLMIQPFDASSLQNIERAISMSDVGLTPNNDGKVIRLKHSSPNQRTPSGIRQNSSKSS